MKYYLGILVAVLVAAALYQMVVAPAIAKARG